VSALGFALVGLAAGSAQGLLLVRAARGEAGAFGVGARILLVAVALLFAARNGYLAAGVLGWGSGFIAACVILRRSVG